MEKHDDEFIGVFIPKELINLRRSGAIDWRELGLLLTINSLQGGKGCFASNEYLGKEIGVSEDLTKRLISKLKKLGLIKQVAFDGRKRWLKSLWECNLQNTSQPARGSSPYHGGGGSITPAARGSSPPYDSKFINNVRPITPKGVTDLTVSRESAPDRERFPRNHEEGDPSYISKPKTTSKGFGLQEDSSSSFESSCSSKLYNALSRQNKIMRRPKITTWKKTFRELVINDSVSEEDVIVVLDWYCRNLGGEFIPDARSAEGFRNKFDQIAAAKERNNGEFVHHYSSNIEDDNFFAPGLSKSDIEDSREDIKRAMERLSILKSKGECLSYEDDEDDGEELVYTEKELKQIEREKELDRQYQLRLQSPPRDDEFEECLRDDVLTEEERRELEEEKKNGSNNYYPFQKETKVKVEIEEDEYGPIDETEERSDEDLYLPIRKDYIEI